VHGEVKIKLHAFLIRLLHGGGWLPLPFGFFNIWWGNPDSHWVGYLVDATAGLDAVEYKRNVCSNVN
jgi:hypothetical protein